MCRDGSHPAASMSVTSCMKRIQNQSDQEHMHLLQNLEWSAAVYTAKPKKMLPPASQLTRRPSRCRVPCPFILSSVWVRKAACFRGPESLHCTPGKIPSPPPLDFSFPNF